MSETFYNIVGRTSVVPPNTAWFESRNPADTRDCLGRFVESDRHAVGEAAEAARAAAAGWANTPAPSRATLLRQVIGAIHATAMTWRV
jgi:alpha-ketoglutaric semialdehyde dehydrogenase